MGVGSNFGHRQYLSFWLLNFLSSIVGFDPLLVGAGPPNFGMLLGVSVVVYHINLSPLPPRGAELWGFLCFFSLILRVGPTLGGRNSFIFGGMMTRF